MSVNWNFSSHFPNETKEGNHIGDITQNMFMYFIYAGHPNNLKKKKLLNLPDMEI